MIGWVDVVGVEVRACLERSYTSYLPCSPSLLTADRNMGAIYDNPIELEVWFRINFRSHPVRRPSIVSSATLNPKLEA